MFKQSQPSTATLRETLRGCETGRLQSVGYMQVIPLVSQLSDDRFVSPVQIGADVNTTSYGTLGFKNDSKNVMIVPCHAGYVVKQKAQDHAMAHAGIVSPQRQRSYDTAMCIQAAQGGFIRNGDYRMMILPHSLRSKALAIRKKKKYGKLWNDIADFNRSLGVKAEGHLEYFLKSFKKELDEFVAEFESVPNQIGAIVLIDNRVAGVERAPSHDYWMSIWPSLIRECYGSLAIEYAKTASGTSEQRSNENPFPKEICSLDELESIISQIAEQEDERARDTVRKLLDEKLTLSKEETQAGVEIFTALSENFEGQVINDGQQVVYASLTATKRFMRQQPWQNAAEFSM